MPIRILNRQESAPTLVPPASAPVVAKRGPVPPPPQRRYFNIVATNGGADDWTDRSGGGSSNRMTVGNVQWHSPANDKHNVPTPSVTATTLNNRPSNFITPPSSDERPSPAGSQQDGANLSSQRSSTLSDHSTEAHDDTGATTSVLMNALEQLYDTPNRMFDEQSTRTPLTITNRLPQGRPISPDRSPTPTTSTNQNYSMIVKQPRPPLSIATAAAAEAKTTAAAAASMTTATKFPPASIGTHLTSQTRANPVAIASTSAQRQDSTQSAASNISKKTVTFSTMNKIETPQTSTTLVTPDTESKQNAKTAKGSIIKNKTTTVTSPARTPFVQSVHEQAARIDVHCTYLSSTSGNTRQWRQPQPLSANLHEIHTTVDELCHQLYLYIHGVTQASKTSGRDVACTRHAQACTMQCRRRKYTR